MYVFFVLFFFFVCFFLKNSKVALRTCAQPHNDQNGRVVKINKVKEGKINHSFSLNINILFFLTFTNIIKSISYEITQNNQ